VTRVGALVFGVRFALAGGGRARVRLALAAAGVAVGTLFLLVALAVGPTVQARSARLDARTPTLVKGAADSRAGVVVSTWEDLYYGRRIRVFLVARVGRGAPIPPGLRRLPGPGEIAVSPRLRDLLRSPDHPLLRERYRGRIEALIGPEGLKGPKELVAWVGARRSDLPQDLPVTASFGAAPQDVTRPPGALRWAVPLGVTGFLVPILVLVMTATRLGSDERDRRLAAVRLVGATPAQARLMAAAEGGLAACLGTVAACLAFAVLRPLVSPVIPVDGAVFSKDATLPAPGVALLVVGLPVLATAASVAAQRRVRLHPLGVARRASVPRQRPRRLLPLALGFGTLSAAWVDRQAVTGGQTRGGVLLVGGAALVLVGLAIATPLVAQAAATLAARGERSVAVLLAARRVQADPAAAARVVTASALLVFIGGWLFSFLPVVATANGEVLRRLRSELEPATFVATADAAARDRVQGMPGVQAAAYLPTVQVFADRAREESFEAKAFDCASLNGVLRRDLPACTDATVYIPTSASGGPSPLLEGGRFTAFREVDGGQWEGGGQGLGRQLLGTTRLAPATPAPLEGLEALNVWALVPKRAMPRQALATTPGGDLLVATDGRAETLEQVRTALQVGQPGYRQVVRTIEELVQEAEAPTTTSRRIAFAGLLVAAFAAACSLAVTLTDSIREQRRSLAALRAAGVPAGTLRRAVLGQTAVTVIPSVALALVCSGLASSLFLAIGDRTDVPFPWTDLLRLAAGCTAVVLAAAGAALPALRAAAAPKALTMD
jgi:hypothetical protein